MTQPAAPPPAPAPEAAPAIAPSTPIAARPAATTRMFDGRRTTVVRPSPGTLAAQAAAVTSAASAVTAAPTSAQITETTGPEAAALASAAEPGAPSTPPSTGSSAESSAATPPVETSKAETISAAEEAKRIARITRASAKLAEEKRTFADERRQHAVNLERVKQLETARDYALRDPAEFVARLYGVDPRQLRARIVEQTIASNARPPQQQAAELVEERTGSLTQKLQEYERTLKDLQAKQVEAEQSQQIARYVEASVLPVLADASKYELTLRALGSADAAAKEVFALQRKRYEATKQTLTPSQAADEIEAYLRGQRDLLTGQNGTSAKPAAPTQVTPQAEPPKAQTNGSQAPKPLSSMAYRNLPKPYTTKVVKP